MFFYFSICKKFIENESGQCIKMFGSDKGGECESNVFHDFFLSSWYSKANIHCQNNSTKWGSREKKIDLLWRWLGVC